MWLYLLKDFSEILNYLPWALAAGLTAYAAVRLANAHLSCEEKLPAGWIVFAAFYVAVVLGLVFFGRPPGSRRSLSLLPFATLGGLRENAYVLENVLLFIPYGVLAARFQGSDVGINSGRKS